MTDADAQFGAIRFGILHGGAAWEHWQIRCLEQLQALPGVHAEISIAPDHPRGALGHGWADVPHMPLTGSEGSRAECRIASAELARLRQFDLDFILCFIDGALPADLLGVPRHGIWRYHWGDWVNYRGAPGGFWEVYDHHPVSAALLVRVQSDPDAVVVLREGFLRTRLLSFAKNREQMRARFSHWPAQVCRDLRGNRTQDPCAGPLLRTHALVRRPPTAWQWGVFGLRIAVRTAVIGFRSLFRHDQWNIGIIDEPIEQCLSLRAPPCVRWLPATRRREYRADPIGVVYQGRPTILCEHFSYRDNLGFIVAIDVERGVPGTRVQIGPEPPVHLSYPFLLEAEGRLLCVPESSAAREIALYEVERFPDRWRKAATLVGARGLVDATLFQYQGRWWLAAGETAEKGANSELHLWFAETLRGSWTAHPGNPVKIDVRSSRPAGTPFWVGGALYRPAQDCSSTYGARVTINRILALTPAEFREEVVACVEPDPRGRYPGGLHTVSRLGERTLIDGKRSVFVAAEFFRALRHYLK